MPFPCSIKDNRAGNTDVPFIVELLPEGSNPSFQCPELLVRHGTIYVYYL